MHMVFLMHEQVQPDIACVKQAQLVLHRLGLVINLLHTGNPDLGIDSTEKLTHVDMHTAVFNIAAVSSSASFLVYHETRTASGRIE